LKKPIRSDRSSPSGEEEALRQIETEARADHLSKQQRCLWIEWNDSGLSSDPLRLVFINPKFKSILGLDHVCESESADFGGTTSGPPDELQYSREALVAFLSQMINGSTYILRIGGFASGCLAALTAPETVDGLQRGEDPFLDQLLTDGPAKDSANTVHSSIDFVARESRWSLLASVPSRGRAARCAHQTALNGCEEPRPEPRHWYTCVLGDQGLAGISGGVEGLAVDLVCFTPRRLVVEVSLCEFRNRERGDWRVWSFRDGGFPRLLELSEVGIGRLRAVATEGDHPAFETGVSVANASGVLTCEISRARGGGFGHGDGSADRV
jgi:hypothetical protein